MERKKNPDSAISLNYNDDDYSQGSGQIKEALEALTEGDILQPYISDSDFRSSKDDNDIGYNLYVFDIRNQKSLEAAQPKKVQFKILEKDPAGIFGYALVLTKKSVIISSDSQHHCDLV